MPATTIAHQQRLETTLARALAERPLSPAEMERLLRIDKPQELELVFRTARALRRRHFGRHIFLYGFLYTSTYCRNNCSFCYYRRANDAPPRYRKQTADVVQAAGRLAASGVHLIDLTMGEDPCYFTGRPDAFDPLVDLVRRVKQATGLPVMASPGVVAVDVLQRLQCAGATWYACYQETHNRGLYRRLRLGQDYDSRLQAKKNAHAAGLLTEEGLLCGVGETDRDVALSMAAMDDLAADQVRVMTFVPQVGTPLATLPPADPLREIKIIALMRLCFPDRLIPGSLDVGGLAGLRQRLDAGANVVTSLVPPGQGLAGVAQSSLDIEDSRRTVASVQPVLAEAGLRAATVDEYRDWIEARRTHQLGGQRTRESA